MIRQHPPQHLQRDNPLWHFALALWQRPAFEQACLDAQAAGISVSHILVALYAARAGCHWSGREPTAITAWREDMTETLRALRTSLTKGHNGTDSLRDTLKKAELEAERVELAWWYHHIHHASTNEFEWLSDHGTADQLARRNLFSIRSGTGPSGLASAGEGTFPPAAMGEGGMSAGGKAPSPAAVYSQDGRATWLNDDWAEPVSNEDSNAIGQNDDGVGPGPADIPPSPMAAGPGPTPSSTPRPKPPWITSVLNAAQPLPAIS